MATINYTVRRKSCNANSVATSVCSSPGSSKQSQCIFPSLGSCPGPSNGLLMVPDDFLNDFEKAVIDSMTGNERKGREELFWPCEKLWMAWLYNDIKSFITSKLRSD